MIVKTLSSRPKVSRNEKYFSTPAYFYEFIDIDDADEEKEPLNPVSVHFVPVQRILELKAPCLSGSPD